MMDSAMFLHLVQVNFTLAEKKQYRTDETKLVSLLGDLVQSNKKGYSIPEIVEAGSALGLVANSFHNREYIFPIARVLASLSADNKTLALRFLTELGKNGGFAQNLDEQVKSWIEKGFATQSPRTVDMMRQREGLATGEIETLQSIGDKYTITRERVRQIEEKFWGEVWQKESLAYPCYLSALLLQLLKDGGSLVVKNRQKDYQIHRFLCKACRVPFEDIPPYGFSLKGLGAKEVAVVKNEKIRLCLIYADQLAKELDLDNHLPLRDSDIQYLASEIVKYNRKHMIRAERLYLTFISIGKPMHFTELLRAHNALFPERTCTERSIRSALNAPRYVSEFGFVWIGTRGTYGLREWGYDKPAENLMDMVTRIVTEKWNETGAPVPLSHIREVVIGVRRVVKPSSIIIAASCNAKLTRLSNRMFVPGTLSKKELADVLKKHNLRLPEKR